MSDSYQVHIVAEKAELRMTVETPKQEAFLESFIDEFGIPKVRVHR